MKPLSITIFGNTNNYPLLLALGLRDLGHSVRLVLDRPEGLHRPESLVPEWATGYPDWIHDCSHLSEDNFAEDGAVLHQAIAPLAEGTDLAILNTVWVSISGKLCCPHIALLTGSDLIYLADFDSVRRRLLGCDPAFRRGPDGQAALLRYADFVARQRVGILGADLVSFTYPGLVPEGDRILAEIGIETDRRHMLRLADTDRLTPRPEKINPVLTLLSGARVVFCGNTHLGYNEMDIKGTEILIEGFARFIEQGGQALLQLPRKGADVEAALALIERRGLTDAVQWLDEMPLNAFRAQMASADVICDQFGTSFPGMVTMDALALGKPVLAHFRNEILANHPPGPLPGFDARTPDEVAEQLQAIAAHPDRRKAVGREGRLFAERHLSPRQAATALLDRWAALAPPPPDEVKVTAEESLWQRLSRLRPGRISRR